MMWRNHLFWRFFLSIMAVVLLTSVISINVERYVSEQYSPHRINQKVDELLTFRQQLEESLSQEDIDTAVQLLQEHPKKRRQFLIFDDYDNEIFGRESLIKPTIDRHFSHPLNNEFRKRNESLQTSVYSILGQHYSIYILPKVSFSPWSSPRKAGTVLRGLLLVFLCAVVCYWLTRTLTRRIRLLQRAVRHLATNNLQNQAPIPHLGHDELGQLGQDFQHMAEQLANSEQARKQMLSDISHELRSPLARQQVAIEIARLHQAKGNNISSQLDRMETENERLNTLIGQIIHIQKLTLDKPLDNVTVVALPSLLRHLIDNVNYEYQQQDKQAGLTLKDSKINNDKASKNAQRWTVLGEAELLSRAFENIIRNAMSHTRNSTNVSIVVSLKKTTRQVNAPVYYLQITISDCGDGIANADAETIFRPFTRLDSSRNRQTGGYGLGLAISKAIIERHNGTIHAANRSSKCAADEQGLIVTITLPWHSKNG